MRLRHRRRRAAIQREPVPGHDRAGRAAWARAVVTTEPPTHDLQIVSRAKTIGRGGETSVEAVRRTGSTVLELRGQIAADAKPVSMTVSVENPRASSSTPYATR